jgi:putative copper export protein
MLDGQNTVTECHYCGRRFPQLYKLTPEDIQREHLPPMAFQVACADCLDRVRLISQVIPEQGFRQVLRNFSWMIPLFSIALVSAGLVISAVRVEGFREFALSSQLLGTGAVLVGTLMVWDRSKNRYAITHDIRWSLNSKKINVAFAIVLAGIAVLALSTILPR